MKIIMTYDIAMACAKDEADRHARTNGRTVWTIEDYNLLCDTFDRLLPAQVEWTEANPKATG